jgi:VWFA-related protein
MMGHRVARAAGAAVVAGFLQAEPAAIRAASGQEAGPPPPTFTADVDLILVDAVVTDAQGAPVTGLVAEDFVVREDGAPQAISSFGAVDLPPTAAAPALPAAPAARWSSNDDKEEPAGRVFLVVMDDAGLGLEGTIAARKAARQFLSAFTRRGDHVSLVVPGSGLTWSARLPEGEPHLSSLVEAVKGRRAASPELAGDFEALQTAESLNPLVQERVRVRLDAQGQLPREPRFPGETQEQYDARNRAYQEGFVEADARRQLEAGRARRRRLFGSVSAALEAVVPLKGKKSVLLFSEGFIREPNDPPFRELVAGLRRANASIYFVDVRRLTSGTAADSREAGDRSTSTRAFDPQESAGAEIVAEETGGFTLQGAALPSGLERVARESSSYYLLGYAPTNVERDGKYRRIAVEVRRPGLQVRARKGYYGPSNEGPRGRAGRDADPELERTLFRAPPAPDIPLRLAAFLQEPAGKGKVRVRLAAEVGLERLRFEPEADGTRVATLDVALALNHSEAAGRVRTPWREWKVKVPAQAPVAATWAALDAAFELPGGPGQATLAVRDRGSRALGSVHHAFEVPDPAAWRVSTPILSDVPGEARARAPRVRLGRSFVSGAPLYCYLEVYPGAKDERAGTPRATLAYSLVDAAGKTKKVREPFPLSPGPAGIPAVLEAIPLTGLAAGAYELRLAVRDEVSGRTLELREPLVVRRPSRPDLAIYLELIDAFLAGEAERAASGVMDWRPRDLAKVAATLPAGDSARRRAALHLHTALAFRLWSHTRALEADGQMAIARALLARDPPPELRREWLLEVGYHHLGAASPAKALPFFEEAVRAFPDAPQAWLGAGMCHEVTAFPDGFVFEARPSQDAAARAERAYREAARLEPALAEARLRLGRVLGLAGAFEEAEKELSVAVEASGGGPLSALARVFWGGIRDQRGDLPGAVRHYEVAAAADPASQTAALALSEALHRSGYARPAAERLASALRPSGAGEVGSWHAYHLGPYGRRPVALSPPAPAPGPLAAGEEP